MVSGYRGEEWAARVLIYTIPNLNCSETVHLRNLTHICPAGNKRLVIS